MDIREFIKKELAKIIETKYAKSAIHAENNIVEKLQHDRLSKEDILRIKDLWNPIIPNIKNGYGYFELFKHLNDGIFNPEFVPMSYMYPTIIRALNPINYIYGLSHKSLYPNIFHGIKQPQSIIKSINGISTDSQNRILKESQIYDAITSQIHNNVLIKAATDTSGGKSVRIISTKELTNKQITDIIESYHGNFVIQQLVKGSPELRKLNKSSLNTLRIMTLALNGKITQQCSMLRIGSAESLVDNLGSGGICVGIDNVGNLLSRSYSFKGVHSGFYNGIELSTVCIPNYDKVKEFVFELHSRIPMCAFAAWDVALDEDNTPVLIEVNLYWPTIFPQICCNKPFFEGRTLEVIDYIKAVKNNNPLYFLKK